MDMTGQLLCHSRCIAQEVQHRFACICEKYTVVATAAFALRLLQCCWVEQLTVWLPVRSIWHGVLDMACPHRGTDHPYHSYSTAAPCVGKHAPWEVIVWVRDGKSASMRPIAWI